MKKVIVSILAILYIGTSTGANVRLHFCMDQLISWQLGHERTGKCENCGMTKNMLQKNGCCKDEQQFVKSSTEQKLQPVFFLQVSSQITAALPSAYIGWPAISYTAISLSKTPQSTQPVLTGPAIYLQNAVFLI